LIGFLVAEQQVTDGRVGNLTVFCVGNMSTAIACTGLKGTGVPLAWYCLPLRPVVKILEHGAVKIRVVEEERLRITYEM